MTSSPKPATRALVKKKAPAHPLNGDHKSHRERIIETATDLFFEYGYDKTNTEKIAQAAKISKREVYQHFADKREILAAVISQVQSGMQLQMDASWSSTADTKEVLISAAQSIQHFILSEQFGKLVRVVAAVSYHDPSMATQFFEMGPKRGRLATAAYLRARMRKGDLRKADPLKAADDFLDLVIGAQLMTAVIIGYIEPKPHRRTHVKHAVEVFLKIYGPSGPPRTS